VVKGEYNKADGFYRYNFKHDGTVNVEYDFVSKSELNPRQISLIFDLDLSCQTLQWDRQAFWTSYPKDHIGRPQGIAHAFPQGRNEPENYRQKPEHSWAYDYHEMGNNDFRAFINNGMSHLLVANYDTGGADIFLATHYENERIKIKTGTKIKGKVTIGLTAGK